MYNYILHGYPMAVDERFYSYIYQVYRKSLMPFPRFNVRGQLFEAESPGPVGNDQFWRWKSGQGKEVYVQLLATAYVYSSTHRGTSNSDGDYQALDQTLPQQDQNQNIIVNHQA